MSVSELDTLLEALQALPKGTTLRGAIEMLGATEPAEQAQAKRQCALARWFDARLYDLLTGDMQQRPDFEGFTRLPGMQAMGSGRFALEDAERSRLLEEWQSGDGSWRKWNLRIGNHFVEREGGDDERLCAVYHLAASPDPAVVIPWFKNWYKDADDRFDLAQCAALLEMLRLQQRFRGTPVSVVWRDYSRYLATRTLFSDDYYKSGSYFERSELFGKFEEMLGAEGLDRPWILHIHATGGAGKTMFLRWLTSRCLAPSRIPCARVDFDDFKPLADVIDRPLRLLVRSVEQWTQQVEGLDALLEKLNREESLTGWNAEVMREVRLQLTGAKLQTPLIIILDTLEEATLSHASWLQNCVSELRKMREAEPRLKLILSGRYDIAGHSNAFADGECVSYEIPRFTEPESHDYLASRGIPVGDVRDAIVWRSKEEEDPSPAGWNPFKLAMFAEIVLDREISAAEIRELPQVDLAYLLERVIRRIDSQPLRWMIRYGAIARQLTPEFVNQVLLPPLRSALRGKAQDRPAEGLGAEYQDAWRPEPGLADEVSGPQLWDDLKRYARHRGWISQVTVDGDAALMFHPEVVGPTRGLLLKQRVFPGLQRRAADHFERKAGWARNSEAEVVRCIRETVYHRFQLQRWHYQRNPRSPKATDGAAYWKKQVDLVETASFGRALRIVEEVLGPDYAEAGKIPIAGIMTPQLLRDAHLRAADLLLKDAGIEFARGRNVEAFLRRCAAAETVQVEGKRKAMPELLATLAKAWAAKSSADALPVLREAIPAARRKHERFFYTLQAAQALAVQRSPEAVRLYREALELLRPAGRTGVAAAEISLELAAFYALEGQHTAVLDSFAEARKQARGKPRLLALALQREAAYCLDVGDVEMAATRLAEMEDVPAEFHSTLASAQIMRARLALANADPIAARQAIAEGRERSTVDLDIAGLFAAEGEAEATLFGFGAALERFESASVSYDLAGVSTGPARCALLSAKLLASTMKNYRDAETRLQQAERIRGRPDPEIQCELLMLRSFTARRRGDARAANAAVTELLARRDPAWPPALRARAMMFALMQGEDRGEEFILELAETLADVQPSTLRDRALEWTVHFRGPLELAPTPAQRILTSYSKSRVTTAIGVRRAIGRADLLRMFGQPEAAVKQLVEAAYTVDQIGGEPGMILDWELNVARRRAGGETAFAALLERVRSSRLVGTVLEDAIHAAAAHEQGVASIGRASELLEREPANIFQAERLESQVSAGLARPEELRSYKERMGWTEIDQVRAGERGIPILGEMVPAAVAEAAGEPERAVEWLVRGWADLAGKLSDALVHAAGGSVHLPETVRIEPAPELSGLPWEMADSLRQRLVVCRTAARGPAAALPAERARPKRSVLYVGPDEELSETAEAVTVASGGSLEALYARYKARPAVVRNADPRFLQEAVDKTPEVRLIHIACTVRETLGGLYLDLQGTRTRGISFGIEQRDVDREPFDLYLSVTRVDTAARRLSAPPLIVLDISHPYNEAEAVRMLLLRNRFAAQLFEMGHVRGILGCGLATPYERLELSQMTVKGLMTKSVGETLADLRRSSSARLDLEGVLPRLGAALWTNNPDDRLFELLEPDDRSFETRTAL